MSILNLGELSEVERDYTLRELCKIENVSDYTLRKRIKAREYETYWDGGRMMITNRSVLARRRRLLADQTGNPRPPLPPPDQELCRKGKAEARARRAAAAAALSPQKTMPPRSRPRKAAASTNATTT